MNRDTVRPGAKLAVLTLYFLSLGITAVQPALADIMAAFPNEPVSWVYLIVTIPTLVALPLNMVFGKIVRCIGYRKLALVGAAVFVVAGVIPYALDSLLAILVARAVFGVSVGILVPMSASLVILLFEGDERTAMLGAGTMASNVGSIFYVMAGALLCTLGWRNTFLVYLVGCVALVAIATFLPEPTQNVASGGGNARGAVPLAAWQTCAVFGVGMLLLYPFFLNFSSLVVTSGIGNASLAGTLLSIGTVAGIVCGAAFPKISSFTKKHSLTLALLFGLACCSLLYFGRTAAMLTLGSMCGGSCMTLLIASSTMRIGIVCEPSMTPAVTGIAMASMNLGSFFATFYASGISSLATSDPLRLVFAISALGFALLAIAQEILVRKPA